MTCYLDLKQRTAAKAIVLCLSTNYFIIRFSLLILLQQGKYLCMLRNLHTYLCLLFFFLPVQILTERGIPVRMLRNLCIFPSQLYVPFFVLPKTLNRCRFRSVISYPSDDDISAYMEISPYYDFILFKT